MIYAIRALKTPYIKIGVSNGSVGRLMTLQCGCPFELLLEAEADWPDSEERKIHCYLSRQGHHFRLEWFTGAPVVQSLIGYLRRNDLSGWHRSITEWATEISRGRRLGRILAMASYA
jgi:hypothetical protein